jgi:hypothetical protein
MIRLFAELSGHYRKKRGLAPHRSDDSIAPSKGSRCGDHAVTTRDARITARSRATQST